MAFILILLCSDEGAIDMQLHDTYYVIAASHIAVLFAILLGLLGCIYWLLRRYKLVEVLTWVHTIVSIIAILGMAIISILQRKNSEKSFEDFRSINSIGTSLIVLFILVQLLLIINIVVAMMGGRNNVN